MSTDYRRAMLMAHALVTTPSDEAIVGRLWGLTYDWMVTAVDVMVVTAGVAAGQLVLEPLGGGTALGTITIGTSAAGVKLSMTITEADKKRSLNTALQLRHNVTEGTGVYQYMAFGVPGWF